MEHGAPPQHALSAIKKYTGVVISPEWDDVEPGRVLPFPLYPVESVQSRADKFQTLCRVRADISSAPYTSNNRIGGTGYQRRYNVILLVGLTELKAQISWEDTAVRVHTVSYVFT